MKSLRRLKLSISMISLLSMSAVADVEMPPLNAIPLFWGLTNNDPKYRDAAFKAQEAFMIQTGIATDYTLLSKFVNNEVEKRAKGVKSNVVFKPNKEIMLMFGIGAAWLTRKEVTHRFRSPFFANVNHTVTLGQSQQSLGVQIVF